MTFNVQEFRAALNLDGARPNLFRINMAFPLSLTALGGVNIGAAQQQLSFMARATQLPGDSIGMVPMYYFGREFKFAGNKTFPEWTVTVVNDEDFQIRSAFETWISGMNSHVGNLRSGTMIKGDGGYQQDAYVTQYGKRGDEIKTYKFVGLFPIDVSPIELDYGANDSIEEFAVTFAYQWWESDTTDSAGSTAPLSPLLPAVN